jgi:hypothetical protein
MFTGSLLCVRHGFRSEVTDLNKMGSALTYPSGADQQCLVLYCAQLRYYRTVPDLQIRVLGFSLTGVEWGRQS